ncbi:UDP-N-acetylmuramoyl-L-alanyl-D-glutamate--2,6-diaminopimelate ligase [Candidatus Falkowbacteria bacterium]|nr:UDP-N-acetylmuramoyl-L-alanyl-D-glutamate--2,6-diaminopimelate ligase [Candidatus Falkowbacteria bacterium]
MSIKEIIKKFIPGFLLGWYHKLLALAANIFYGFPSNKLIVIGVTGTNGKSTTVHLIAKMFEGAGFKVGATSTVGFKVAGEECLNKKKMTMLGRFALQKLLRQMVAAGCRYAIIETSSQGVEQFRHLGVNYDVAVFTNLTPEHIEAHGGFENYKKAKGKFFQHLTAKPRKMIDGKKINKVSVVNLDDEHAKYFAEFSADEKIKYGIKNQSDVRAENVALGSNGVDFTVRGVLFHLNLLGEFNVYNVLAAVAVGLSQGLTLDTISSVLEKVRGVPGRMEFIDEGQNFKVLVDYAPEPESMRQLYKTVHSLQFIVSGAKIIHVLGSAGGGRDKSRRTILGGISAENADYVIITNEDPYDENPMEIINQVAAGAAGKQDGVNLFKILDRGEAIAKALGLARENDLVIITGKGSEQAICVVDNKKIPWDDREKVREILKNKF